jgi:hypothetical protein
METSEDCFAAVSSKESSTDWYVSDGRGVQLAFWLISE